ncbi:18198_t:CDS:2 [Gigaspora rosea]|nr:18198_t:CDS:2 [Gigaspora rosea]
MTAEAVLALRTLFPTWDPCPDASGRTWHRATLLISWVIAAGSIPSVTLLASDCRFVVPIWRVIAAVK